MRRLIGRRRQLEPEEVGPPRSLRELIDRAKESLAREGGHRPALYVSRPEGSATFVLAPGEQDDVKRAFDDLIRGTERFVLVETRRENDGGETVLLRAHEGRRTLEWAAHLEYREDRTVRPSEWVRLR